MSELPDSYGAVHRGERVLLLRDQHPLPTKRLTVAGWVTRFRPRLSKGKHEWIYQLDRKGFELGKRGWGLDGLEAWSPFLRIPGDIETTGDLEADISCFGDAISTVGGTCFALGFFGLLVAAGIRRARGKAVFRLDWLPRLRR